MLIVLAAIETAMPIVAVVARPASDSARGRTIEGARGGGGGGASGGGAGGATVGGGSWGNSSLTAHNVDIGDRNKDRWTVTIDATERDVKPLFGVVGTGMDISQALDFVRQRNFGVLTTQRRDGRPQLSNVAYSVGDDGVISVSITDTRAKTKNMRRDPRTSLHVTREDFWAYCVLDCDASLLPVVTDPNDATADALVEYYRRANGEHPDWDDYRQAMVADKRLLAHLTPTHAYGMLGR